MSKLADAMAERSARRKASPARKLKKEKGAPAPSIPQAAEPGTQLAGTQLRTGDLPVRAHLEKGISELQGLHELLLCNDVDPDVLADFREALNRVRNTAWAAQQYVVRKELDHESTSVLSFLAGERIRVAYQLCQTLSDDLRKTEIVFQRGSLVQLCEITKTLTKQLKNIIDKL